MEGPNEEFNQQPTAEDFNEPTAQRVAILKRLEEAIGSVAPHFWAACQVCHIQKLAQFVEFAHREGPGMARIVAAQTQPMIKYWTQRSPKGSSVPSTPQKSATLGSSPAGPSPSKKQKMGADSPGEASSSREQDTGEAGLSRGRDKKASSLARERDNNRCVLTGNNLTIEVAHIYPYCQLRNAEEDPLGVRRIFWDHLRNFWPEEKVAVWQAQLFPQGLSGVGAEGRVDNRITLSKDAHEAWNKGAFALKPISEDRATLTVQFFWQKRQTDARPPMSLTTIPHSTENLDAFDKDFTLTRQRQYIRSGNIFELNTNDPVRMPLPNFALLELQWFLTRIVGMAGADSSDEEAPEDSDGDVSNLGLADAGEESLLSDLSLLDLPDSPQFLRKAAEGGSKHQVEAERAAERDSEEGVGAW